MIKGVNKQIIEIRCPKDEHFEKILLFLNSEKFPFDERELNEKAKAVTKTFLEHKRPRRRPLAGRIVKEHGAAAGVCAAVVSAAVAAAVLLL